MGHARLHLRETPLQKQCQERDGVHPNRQNGSPHGRCRHRRQVEYSEGNHEKGAPKRLQRADDDPEPPRSRRPNTRFFLADARTRVLTDVMDARDCDDLVLRFRAAQQHLPDAPSVVQHSSWKNDTVDALTRMHQALHYDTIPNTIDALRQDNADRLVERYAALLRSQPKRAWQHVFATNKKTTTVFPAQSPEQRRDKLYAHFRVLFEVPPTDTPPPAFNNIPTTSFRTGPITHDEITRAAAMANNWKALGIDGIPNELLKQPEMRDTVCRLLNQWYEHGVPDAAKTSALVPLPKKGDLSQPSNWRGISLMSHVAKMYDTVLLLRLRDSMDSLLLPWQNGFRPERGCPGHIVALTRLIQESKARPSLPLHGCFVDFSKAFDSVQWNVIESVLRSWGTPDELLHAVFSMMKGHTLRVKTSDGELIMVYKNSVENKKQ
eukprot:PhM_4_TR13956/c1_g1_i9/m.32052